MKDFSQQGNNHSSFRKAVYLYKHFMEGVNKQEQEDREVEDEAIENMDLDLLTQGTSGNQVFGTIMANLEEILVEEVPTGENSEDRSWSNESSQEESSSAGEESSSSEEESSSSEEESSSSEEESPSSEEESSSSEEESQEEYESGDEEEAEEEEEEES
ncbi:hypothetical protein ACIQ4Z_01760 [Peribacillus asahii]|uniref:hypothetical protein n=1 Tax=Peribacillus asahii TaxID=228899 RepID=UPI0038160D94